MAPSFFFKLRKKQVISSWRNLTLAMAQTAWNIYLSGCKLWSTLSPLYSRKVESLRNNVALLLYCELSMYRGESLNPEDIEPGDNWQ